MTTIKLSGWCLCDLCMTPIKKDEIETHQRILGHVVGPEDELTVEELDRINGVES